MKIEGKGNVWLGDPFDLPVSSPVTETGAYRLARAEHAILLRCEGKKLREIGICLDASPERARQMLISGARHLQHGMQRTKFRWTK